MTTHGAPRGPAGLRLRARRAGRMLRNQPQHIQALAAAAALVLVAGLTTAATDPSDSGTVTATDEMATPGTAPGDPDFATTPSGDGRTGSTEPADATGAPGDPTVAGDDPGAGAIGPDAAAPTDGPADPAVQQPPGDTAVQQQPGATACGDGAAPASSGTRAASDRGVSAGAVKVVFPVFDPTAAFSLVGADANIEVAEDMIRACVDHVNANGGIDGRLIDAIVQVFNPLNDVSMRAQCIKWATDDKVFAVVESDAWHTQAQLCLTEEHDTPLISRWTTTAEWTDRGAPYLWWTAPNADDIIANWVAWAVAAGHAGGANVVGVVMSDRESDTLARAVMEQALKRHGVKARFEVVPFEPASAQVALPGAVQRMKAAKVNKLFTLLPFTAYGAWLTHADQQEFYPRYLVSDYEATVVVTDALLGARHPDALHDAVGPTHIDLGRLDRLSNFRPAPRRCNDVFMEAYPDHAPKKIQIAGVAMRWCENITVFVEAARRASRAAGGNLTRRNFTKAMAGLDDFPGRMTPQLRFAPDRYSGPEQMKVVRIQTRDCAPEADDTDPDNRNGVCTVEVEPYRPIRRS